MESGRTIKSLKYPKGWDVFKSLMCSTNHTNPNVHVGYASPIHSGSRNHNGAVGLNFIHLNP